MKYWDASWNPITGCSKISDGCKNCWAHEMAGRFPKIHGADSFSEIVFHPDRLEIPLRRRKPTVYSVCWMGDLFHEQVRDEQIAEIFGVMAICAHVFACGRVTARNVGPNHRIVSVPKIDYGPHQFLVLTKRPNRMRRLLITDRWRNTVADAAYRHAYNRTDAGRLAHQIGTKREEHRCYEPGQMWPLPNVWLGVSVEDQAAADERIPLLLEAPAAHRWVSAEPLLGPIGPPNYLRSFQYYCGGCTAVGYDEYGEVCVDCPGHDVPGLDAVIAGGESGPKARPCHPDWARSLRDQCADAGVPFTWKQWGTWHPGNTDDDGGYLESWHEFEDGTPYHRARTQPGTTIVPMIDGREHVELPWRPV